MSHLRQRVRAGLPYTVLTRALVNGIPALVVLAAVKLVSPVEFGIYNVLLALGGLLGKLTALGWPDAIARYLPRLDTHDDQRRLTVFVVEAVVSRVAVAGAIGLLLILTYRPLAPVLHIEGHERAFVVFVGSLILLTLSDLLTASLQSLLKQGALFAVGAVISAFQVAYIATLFVRGGSLLALVWMELAKNALLVLLQAGVLLRTLQFPTWQEWWARTHRVRDAAVTRFRWYSVANDLGIEILSSRADYLVLTYLANSLVVAVYAVATRAARLVEMLVPVTLLKGPLESAFYRSYERNRTPDNLNRMFGALTKADATVLGLFAAVGAIYGEPVFRAVFGAQYAISGIIFTLYVFVLWLTHFPTGFVLRAIERMDLVLWGKLSFIPNILLAVFLVPRWGAIGMAVATLLALLLRAWLPFMFAHRHAGLRMPWGSLGRIVANVALTAGILAVFRLLTGTSGAEVAAGVILGVVGYAGLTLVNSGYTGEELRLFSDLLPPWVREQRLVKALVGGLLMRARAV